MLRVTDNSNTLHTNMMCYGKLFCGRMKSLKTQKELSEAINRRADNRMTKRKRERGRTNGRQNNARTTKD